MRTRMILVVVAALGIIPVLFSVTTHVRGLGGSFSEIEPGFETDEMELAPFFMVDPYANWTRPDGPLRVGIQAGHWHAADAPDEQEGLRDNTGTSAAGFTEWETNLRIAEETKTLLEAEGVVVDLLPTTIPPDYWADAFISIHADGNTDSRVNGYKVAAARRDRSGTADRLSGMVEASYGSSTNMIIDPSITRSMRGYYAFNWRRYEHSIHPMTPGIIVETGFLTNSKDRTILVQHPRKAAEGIATGVIAFLDETISTSTLSYIPTSTLNPP